jgi:hypothetical protein
MCTTGPAAVDKPVNIGGRIKFAIADQPVGFSTRRRAKRLMSGDEHRIGCNNFTGWGFVVGRRKTLGKKLVHHGL